MSQAPVICENLCKSFDQQLVVNAVSFQVAAGQILALLGPSGCGKTTTLRLIAGFEQLDNGRILINGQEVANGRNHLPPEKRRAGMVFQDYAIFPHLSVAENVAFGLPRRERKNSKRADEMLEFVGLSGLGAKMPHELSGGQQQRVALARALAPKPAVLLLDEPFSNLDAALRMEVRQEVKTLLKQANTTAVFVTHDQEEALFLGDTVAVMQAGRLEQIGTPEAVFHQPQTRFVAEFMGESDFAPGTVSAQGIDTPLGKLALPTQLAEGTAVDVLLRPDDVKLEADPSGNGRIISRQFLGIAYLYRVALADGTIVHSWQSHQMKFLVGTAVCATLRPQHIPTVFYQNQPI